MSPSVTDRHIVSASDLIALLDAGCAPRGRWCTGYQVAVRRGDDQLLVHSAGVDGRNQPVDDASLFSIYCAGKPLTALAIGVLIDRGEVSFDDRLGDLVDRPLNPLVATKTVEQLLGHRAGLAQYGAAPFLMMPPAKREEAVRQVQPSVDPIDRSVYAEFVSWELLRYAVEDVTRSTLPEYVARNVVRPAGLDGDMAMCGPGSTIERERLRLNADVQTGQPFPLLWESTAGTLADTRAAGGTVATMTALARLYAVLLSIAAGEPSFVSSDVLRLMIEPGPPTGYDPVLGRECRHGLGFMVGLGWHRFGTGWSSASFGHTGFKSMTFAGADPQRNASFAVHLNGVTSVDDSSTDPDRNPVVRRELLGSALLTLADR